MDYQDLRNSWAFNGFCPIKSDSGSTITLHSESFEKLANPPKKEISPPVSKTENQPTAEAPIKVSNRKSQTQMYNGKEITILHERTRIIAKVFKNDTLESLLTRLRLIVPSILDLLEVGLFEWKPGDQSIKIQ